MVGEFRAARGEEKSIGRKAETSGEGGDSGNRLARLGKTAGFVRRTGVEIEGLGK